MSEAEKPSLAPFDGFVPERATIDAYGNGGFRFAGMSHRGSLLVLADGIAAWRVSQPDSSADLSAPLLSLLERLEPPQFLLLGTGVRQLFPAPEICAAFGARGVGLEAMDTGAACRTYNILLAEQRPVMAALIAVG